MSPEAQTDTLASQKPLPTLASREDLGLPPLTRRKTLTVAERLTVYQLSTRGYKPYQIATALGRCVDAIQNCLVDAKAMMAVDAPLRVSDWALASRKAALRGNHSPARDWLLHTGVIEPLAEKSGVTVQVAVGLSLPGLPGAGESGQNLSVTVADTAPPAALPVLPESVTPDDTGT